MTTSLGPRLGSSLFLMCLGIWWSALDTPRATAQEAAAAKEEAPATSEKQLEEVLKQLDALRKQVEQIRTGTKKPATETTATTKRETKPREFALPSDWVKALKWRSIGPAGMGGRITAVSVFEADPSIWYIATASGGLLKTTNNGVTFEHQFDNEATVSIGDVCVAPSDANIVWVGTGEANPRNSVSYGDGVYKSTDGGKKWINMGLTKSYQIGKIMVHPTNPDIVYVGALGRLYGPSAERGLYKTIDGGKTWERVLPTDDKTGVIDIVMHPTAPDTMIVATWERQRDGYDSHPGQPPVQDGYDLYDPIKKWGPGSGLHKTTDGGKTWKKLNGDAKSGLPTGQLGRMDVDWYRKDPNILFAIIDCENIGKGIAANRVYLGVQGQNGGGGAQITQITPKGPAEQAGLKVGDVIKSLNGQPITGYSMLTDALKGKPAGEKLKLEVVREEKTQEIEATLSLRPLGATVSGPSSGYLGFQGEDTSDGVKIIEIIDGGPAARADLRPGDIVKSAKKEPINSYEQFTEMLRTTRAGDQLALEIARDGKVLEITATLDARPTGGFSGGGATGSRVLSSLLGISSEDLGGGGIKVERVSDSSVASKAGIDVGDVLHEFDGKPITTAAALLETLRERFEGDEVTVKGLRDKEARDFKLKLEPPGGVNTRPFGFQYGGQSPNAQGTQGPNEFEYGGVYRSADGGETWTRINSLNPRPMYFSQVRVDPQDEKYLYVLGVSLHRSKDGGKTFTADGGRNVHADFHALWIDPKDGRHMVVGTDGGFYATWDRMTHWEHLNHLAIAQFYHVALDNRQPYRAYGGLQDNGSWGGPTRTLNGTGPINSDWISVGTGDGFVCRVDPFDPDIVYSESQNGALSRRNLKTGERRGISPRGQRGQRFRFNWNTPFILSNHNPGIYYTAGNYVFRSVKRGDDLKVISPEIARTGRGTGTALAESPQDPDVLWAGTDDGNLWITRDGGANWKNVADKVGLPGPRWVATVEPSRFVVGRCYVSFDAHRSDDDEPYICVTEDFGETWRSLRANLPVGSTRCLREDVRNPNLLFVGTEFAVFASINRGESWTKANNNLPTVAIHELAIHPTAGEMVAATHGRSLWVVDITPLRQMTADVLQASAHLFEPNTVVRWRGEPSRGIGGGSQIYSGANPSRSASLTYALAEKAQKVSLRILDHTGTTVRTLPGRAEPGLYSVTWDLSRSANRPTAGSGVSGGQRGSGGSGGRPRGDTQIDRPAVAGSTDTARSPATQTPRTVPSGTSGGGGGGSRGPSGTGGGSTVSPGMYRVVLDVDGREYAQSLRIEADPVIPGAIAAEEMELPERLRDEEKRNAAAEVILRALGFIDD
ncbi:MAG: PDZ domain-containing protein [Planctomycetes bacterium]|nr:PDZ domain-containing protein [Planctomycetota bacterium]